MITNNHKKPYYFSYYVKSKMETVQLAPGTNACVGLEGKGKPITDAVLVELKKIKMFNRLVKGGTLVVGAVEATEAATDETELSDEEVAAAKKAAKAAKAKATRAAKKAAKAAKDAENKAPEAPAGNGAVDLESF